MQRELEIAKAQTATVTESLFMERGQVCSRLSVHHIEAFPCPQPCPSERACPSARPSRRNPFRLL